VGREETCMQQINMKGLKFGIFSHLHQDLLENEEKFCWEFRMKIEKFYHFS
jgi:hypothetical protein